MEQEIEKALTKVSLFSKLPKWLRVILIIISIITIIWWLCWLLLKINKLIRKALAWVSQPRNWYWFEGIALFAIICGLFVAQFCSDFKPFTRLWNNIKDVVS
ncbi:MAG: hypothetical protein ACI35W_03000, partial [Anaeroplasmataceae bacterium]